MYLFRVKEVKFYVYDVPTFLLITVSFSSSLWLVLYGIAFVDPTFPVDLLSFFHTIMVTLFILVSGLFLEPIERKACILSNDRYLVKIQVQTWSNSGRIKEILDMGLIPVFFVIATKKEIMKEKYNTNKLILAARIPLLDDYYLIFDEHEELLGSCISQVFI